MNVQYWLIFTDLIHTPLIGEQNNLRLWQLLPASTQLWSNPRSYYSRCLLVQIRWCFLPAQIRACLSSRWRWRYPRRNSSSRHSWSPHTASVSGHCEKRILSNELIAKTTPFPAFLRTMFSWLMGITGIYRINTDTVKCMRYLVGEYELFCKFHEKGNMDWLAILLWAGLACTWSDVCRRRVQEANTFLYHRHCRMDGDVHYIMCR